MRAITNFFYSVSHFIYRFLVIKYHNVPFYRAKFWKLISDRIILGYDESVTWDLRYYSAKWLYPRLELYWEQIEKLGGCPHEYENKMTVRYIQMGHEWDPKWHRFKDNNIEHLMHRNAMNAWKDDVYRMYQAFKDMVREDDDWDGWMKYWGVDVRSAQSVYDTLKTDKERKAYWDKYEFAREWYPGIKFNECDFSQKMRKIGLDLFAKHFESLWW